MAEYNVNSGDYVQHSLYSHFKDFLLKNLINFYKAMKVTKSNNLKLLDYGCGPTITDKISAAPKVSEIYLAEYMEPFRDFIQKWLDKNSTAFDWSPSFKHVVQTLEGGTEEEAEGRQDEVRSKIKAVVSCDITKDQFIAEGFEGPYDIVQCSLCLENPCRDYDSYRGAIKKLASLLRSGGYFILYSSFHKKGDECFYIINGRKFFHLALDIDFILDTLKDNKFIVITLEQFDSPPSESDTHNESGFVFISACKE